MHEVRVHKIKDSAHQSTKLITSDFRAGVMGTIPSVIKLMGELALSQWVLVIGFSGMPSKVFLTTAVSQHYLICLTVGSHLLPFLQIRVVQTVKCMPVPQQAR